MGCFNGALDAPEPRIYKLEERQPRLIADLAVRETPTSTRTPAILLLRIESFHPQRFGLDKFELIIVQDQAKQESWQHPRLVENSDSSKPAFSMETPAIHRLRLNDDDKPEPLDLSHHFSVVTQRRVPSELKRAYKFFQIPGILNIAGGSYFPCPSQTSTRHRVVPQTHSHTRPMTRSAPCRLLPL
jgi:hypothetical protein